MTALPDDRDALLRLLDHAQAFLDLPPVEVLVVEPGVPASGGEGSRHAALLAEIRGCVLLDGRAVEHCEHLGRYGVPILKIHMFPSEVIAVEGSRDRLRPLRPGQIRVASADPLRPFGNMALTTRAMAEQCRAAVAHLKDLAQDKLGASVESADTEEGTPKSTDSAPTHSTDFTSVNWFGARYQFTKTQAECIRILWREWEKGEHSLSEKTIGDEVDAAKDRFRLSEIFHIKGSEYHAAWDTMIVSVGKGIFALKKPESP